MGTMLATSAGFYARERPRYPDVLLEFLVEACALRPGDRVADVGCGAGRLTVALAERGLRVAAVEPWPEMLEAARDNAPAACKTSIDWIPGAAEDILRVVPAPVKAVTFANSFHCCKDRQHVLGLCDRVIEPSGTVAILHSRWKEDPPSWFTIIDRTAREFATISVDEHRQPRIDTSPASDEEVLSLSRFRRVEKWSLDVDYDRTIDQVVRFTYSMFVYPPASFGESLDRFEETARARLTQAYPDGNFNEHCTLTVTLGRRD